MRPAQSKPSARVTRSALCLIAAATATLILATSSLGADFQPSDAGYHSYAEMVDHVTSMAATQPGIVRVFSIGQSFEGRELWAAEVSDNVGVDEGEPEVLLDGLHHADEHLGAEMAIYVLDLLAGRYGQDSKVGRLVTRLVDGRRTFIVFMVDPDGLEYVLGGDPYRAWRKNRQPTVGSGSTGLGGRVRAVGTDLNRNWGYRWGCCGGSSGDPGSWYYRGPRPWSAPEVRALRDFVLSRVVDGRQRIRTHITFHSAGEQVLWPYAYTRRDLTRRMSWLDLRTFRAMGRAMAASNGYVARQSSGLYRTDGDMIDWMYARQRIFSFTFELYPRGGVGAERHLPPDEVIGRETKRNRDAVLYLIAKAGCPYSALGRWAARMHCR
jgi:murein tripeptide amidase MpaA